MGHDIKGGADDVFVFAIDQRPRRRKVLTRQSRKQFIFAVDGMGGGQQFARWFAPQDIAAAIGHQMVGRVGLSAFKLIGRAQTGKGRNMA